jgi:8-oxo-dGTP diphosphatase
MKVSRFNIRVYILLLDEPMARVLLSDEIVDGEYITKFPGGGLETGEGILDCLYREAREELGQEVEVLRQFYTSETFQVSRYRPEDQIICVYYICRLPCNGEGQRQPVFRVAEQKFDFVEIYDRAESSRWQALADLQAEDLSLPLDRQVVSRLLAEHPR